MEGRRPRRRGRNRKTFLEQKGVREVTLKGGKPSARPGSDAKVTTYEPQRRDPEHAPDPHQTARRLRKALAGDLSLLKELRAQSSGDVVDAALDSVQDEISSQLAEVESRELARIEYALERMREGQFGICEGCGAGIPMARLNALPYATYCITCQREAERQGSTSSADVDWGRLLDTSGGDTDLSINDIELDVL